MSATPDTSATLFARLRRQTRIARAFLVWETYAPVLAPALLAISVFAICALTGIWERIGDPWRLIALIITLAIMARSVLSALPLRFPTQSDAQRRLECDSGQAHRPLDTLADRPAISADAWPAHYKQAMAQAETIQRPKRQHPLAPQDKYYLRFIAPLCLMAAMVYSAGFGFERLRNAANPSWQAGINPAKVSFEAWIDPPAYTGRPPIYFKDGSQVIVPAGSEFVARLTGAANAPRPKLWQGPRARFLPLTQLGAKSYEARAVIDRSGRAEWRIGTHREVWSLNTKADAAPNVDFVDPPEADKRDRLVFSYQLDDDYGVERLQIEMAEIVDGIAEDALFDAPTTFAEVPLSGSSVKATENTSAALDLTKHIWAGRKVIGRLIAMDGAGQQAVSAPAFFTVPDKIFVEPLAKAVVEQRQLVLAAKDQNYIPAPRRTADMGYFNTYEPELRLDRAPATIQRAALLIDAVTDAPDGLFQDPAVFIGLRHVHSRLRYADEAEDLNGIPEDLWKIALRAEFGVLGTALEEMREAEAALREGMARRAPQREIDTLFERYNLAVEAYTEELRRKALEEGNVAEGGGGEGGAMGSVDEIQELLKAIEEANAAGDTEGARKALARLAELLENMEIQLAQGGGGEGGDGAEGEISEEMKKSLEDLADMMGEQRELQDETRQAERRDEDDDEALSPQELAQRQAELENLLDQLGDALPQDLADARAGDTEGDSGQAGDSGGETAGGQDGQGTEPGQGREPGQGAQDGQGGETRGGRQPGQTGEQGTIGQRAGGDQSGGSGASVEELLDRARRAMRESEDGLQAGELGQAGDAQAQVLRELREAGKILAEAASADGRQRENGAGGQDPLGRSDDGINSVISESDLEMRDNATRSRELLEELRRRASEQERKKEERDYLERLLKRF